MMSIDKELVHENISVMIQRRIYDKSIICMFRKYM